MRTHAETNRCLSVFFPDYEFFTTVPMDLGLPAGKIGVENETVYSPWASTCTALLRRRDRILHAPFVQNFATLPRVDETY